MVRKIVLYMKVFLIVSIIILLFIVFYQTPNSDFVEQTDEGVEIGKKTEKTKLDPEDYTLLQYPEGVVFSLSVYPSYVLSDEKVQYWRPTLEDIAQVESILEQCVHKDYPNIHAKLQKYKRQYVGFIDQNGQRTVGIYAFIGHDNLSWKEGPVIISDGGDSVFQTTVNLDQNTCSRIHINGDA